MPATIFVDNGTDLVSDALLTLVGASVTASGFYIGWGTGGSSTGGTATNTDVDLEAPFATRVSCTGESQSAPDTNQFIGTLLSESVLTIEEAGLYIDATGTSTDMLIRANHGGVVMATDDQIEYTFTLQLT